MNGAVDTLPMSVRTSGEFAACEATVTVAVRCAGVFPTGANVTVNVQKVAPSTHCEVSIWKSDALAPPMTGAPVVRTSIEYVLLVEVWSPESCEVLVEPGAWPLKVNVAGTNDALSSVPA